MRTKQKLATKHDALSELIEAQRMNLQVMSRSANRRIGCVEEVGGGLTPSLS